MGIKRIAAAATVLALGGAAVSAGGATAATNGVGTSMVSTKVLGVGVGSLLSIKALTDASKSTTDPTVAAPSVASSTLSPLSIASASVSALNVAAPSVTVKSTGATQSIAVPTVGVPGAVPAAVATGSVSPGTLNATVDSAGAHSGLSSSVTNLTVAGGGILSLPSLTSSLGTSAGSANANGTRGVAMPSLTVLDLGALLKGLGIDPASLSLATVTNLVGQLGITVPGLPTTAALTGALTSLPAAISGLQATIGSAVGSTPIAGVVDPALGGILGGLGGIGGVPTTPPTAGVTTADQVLAQINALVAQLQSLLNSALAVLDASPLLAVTGLEVGLTAKAGDSLANSAASVTGKVGSVKVGSLTVPGVDLAAAGANVAALVNSVTAKVSGILGTINPALANLVSVKVLEQSKSVSSSGGYTHAVASITGLAATVTPPANLAGIVSALKRATFRRATYAVTDPVSSILGTAAAPLAQVTNAAGLASALGVASALTSGAAISVAEVSASSDFAPTAGVTTPGTTPGELPRTGTDTSLLAVFGVLLIATAAGIIRWLRTPTRID
ncbi:MAG: hypothetical protein JWO37_3063 [Acidimicrobiales bacterium]|jgi:LPXTG-motif cell wall-anchored protein|nr:hypothetical protein [Acidimicrobiales bacterium]